MAKIHLPNTQAEICKALGVPDPEYVHRIVLDIRSGDFTRVYVERIGDDEALIRDLVPLLMGGQPIGEPVEPDLAPVLDYIERVHQGFAVDGYADPIPDSELDMIKGMIREAFGRAGV